MTTAAALRPDASVRLGWTDQELSLEPNDGLSDVDHAGVEVEIADPQAADFAGPQPTPTGQEQRHPSRVGDGVQVSVELVDREDLDLAGALFLSTRLHPARVGLEDAVLNGFFEDGFE